MAVKDYTTTSEGIELQFGVNHIGHFLLTSLLLPKILAASKGARVINVSSFGYLAAGVRFNDWNFKVLFPILTASTLADLTMQPYRMGQSIIPGLPIRSPKQQTSSLHLL